MTCGGKRERKDKESQGRTERRPDENAIEMTARHPTFFIGWFPGLLQKGPMRFNLQYVCLGLCTFTDGEESTMLRTRHLPDTSNGLILFDLSSMTKVLLALFAVIFLTGILYHRWEAVGKSASRCSGFGRVKL